MTSFEIESSPLPEQELNEEWCGFTSYVPQSQGGAITTKATQIIEKKKQASLSTNDWLRSIIECRGKRGTNQSQLKPQIQEVPRRLREIEANKKCFIPRVVAIGPYHSGKPEFQMMEEHKLASVRQFLLGSKAIDVFFNKILEVAPNAKKCYADCTTAEFDDEKFARMMFLDGCFVLHFIYCMVNNEYNELAKFSNFVPLVQKDLFLLENQLPFVVLQTLMSLKFSGDIGREIINKYIKQQITHDQGHFSEEESSAEGGAQPHHLLDLLRTELLRTRTTCEPSRFSNACWYPILTVKELRSVGIDFKRSQTSCLRDVRFNSYKIYGKLSLPPIAIDCSTKSTFLNLIAYEMCQSAPHDYAVTSYIYFLHSLINCADDVKELQSKGILLNSLGSNRQVVDLFNQLAIDLEPDPSAYYEVRAGLESYYENNVWISIVESLRTLKSHSKLWTLFAAGFLIFVQSLSTHLIIFVQSLSSIDLAALPPLLSWCIILRIIFLILIPAPERIDSRNPNARRRSRSNYC